MVDGLKPTESVEQVKETKDLSPDGLQTQILNLQGMVFQIEAERQGMDFLRQELRDSSRVMEQAINQLRDSVKEIKECRRRIKALEDRLL